MNTHQPTTMGVQAWQEVIALLLKASERGHAQAKETPTFGMVALSAYILASEAALLLPPQPDPFVEDVELPGEVARLDAAGLIRAAADITGDYTLEQFPAGASPIILNLVTLAARVSR